MTTPMPPMVWTDEQMANAQVIIAVGRDLGMSGRDIVTGLMAAMVESNLINVGHGDRDSLGLFQQRPSQGWGTSAEVMNPIYAAQKFFAALKKIKNRGSMSMGAAAQAVQRSAHPERYALRENDARRMMLSLGQRDGGLPFPLRMPGMDVDDRWDAAGEQTPEQAARPGAGVSDPLKDTRAPAFAGIGASTEPVYAPAQPQAAMELMPGMENFSALNQMVNGGTRAQIVGYGLEQLGVPYSWGGGGAGGKSLGIGRGSGTVGFDCSGLVQYIFARAGIKLPRIAADQLQVGQRTSDIASLQPGDLVGPADGSHIGVYIGGGKFLNAPSTGQVVMIEDVPRGYIGVRMGMLGDFAMAPGAGVGAPVTPGVASTQPEQVTTYAGL